MMTIGHSTLSIEAFLRALKDNDVQTLVDVRTAPGSRRHPQFGKEALRMTMDQAGVRYLWRKGLGGWRAVVPDSVNTAWRNKSFQGYADYMQTAKFARELDWLMSLTGSVAIMCCEAVPWRCHRSMITDALLAHGIAVEDIYVTTDGASVRKAAKLHEHAKVNQAGVWYPAPSLFTETVWV